MPCVHLPIDFLHAGTKRLVKLIPMINGLRGEENESEQVAQFNEVFVPWVGEATFSSHITEDLGNPEGIHYKNMERHVLRVKVCYHQHPHQSQICHPHLRAWDDLLVMKSDLLTKVGIHLTDLTPSQFPMLRVGSNSTTCFPSENQQSHVKHRERQEFE